MSCNTPPSADPGAASRTDFSPDEVAAVYRAINERRDMRHFRPDPVDAETLRRLLEAAHRAPSVGYMQPWRFLRITDPAVREALHAHAADEQTRTAEACGERAAEVHRLKLEGIREAGELLVVALTDGRERYVLGRRTLPEMDLCSAACAIQNLWLAARAEGLGMGWVSLFDPDWLADRLDMPEGGYPIAVLCLGHVERFYDRPMLETAGWDTRRPLEDLVFQDRWGAPCELALPTVVRESAARPDGLSGGGDT
ncbi:5,6-dimethylbenzimidazole synthase [Thioalkalivibrio sp. ALMg13-2]|uniref:5,6-dimethylbenzimidazole synthase n=1 Tax=Thioalkalivibrio sp. ALMg13-2 TaxID=1158167 RepID=UPI00035C37EA|nr:5,6-dimethylbenzimidazole synthase [Thioalkalivibrio sp. ALMg13-2]